MNTHRVWLLDDILLDIAMVFICLCNNHVIFMYLCLTYVFVSFTVVITCESCVIECLMSTRACLAHHVKVCASWEESVNQTNHNTLLHSQMVKGRLYECKRYLFGGFFHKLYCFRRCAFFAAIAWLYCCLYNWRSFMSIPWIWSLIFRNRAPWSGLVK